MRRTRIIVWARDRRGASTANLPPLRTTGWGRRSLAAAAAFALLAPILVAGCGKKGPPRPPPRLIPAPIQDLRVRQTADRLVLEMTYPAVTTGGLPLPVVEAVEVVAMRPRAVGGTVPRIEPATFAVTAQVARRLEGPDLLAATRGAELSIELDASPGAPMGPLSEAEVAAQAAAAAEAAAAAQAALAEATATPTITHTPTAVGSETSADPNAVTATPSPGAEATAAASATATPTAAGPPPILLAVRTFGPRKNESPLSNIVSIVPRLPPVAPATLTLEPVAEGVRLAWSASGGAPVLGYDVLRRKQGESAFIGRVAQVGAEQLEHVDTTAVYGDRYEYTVRSVAARDPLVESGDGPVRDIEYADTFAPPTPVNLVALAEEGRVRLLWDRVDAPDLAGYRLYRQENGGAEIELPRDPGAGADHLDTGVRAGITYSYRVTAVDHEDNESEKSEPAAATPR